MIIPVGLDDEEVRRTPWISYGIIAANVLAFILVWIEAAHGGAPLSQFGYIPAEPQIVNLVTSLFVHAGLFHLLGNMLFFFVTGPFIEDLYGRPLFALLYVASGVAANLAHAAMNPDSFLPTVGASGAISGIMGAFLVRLATRRIRFLWLPLPPIIWVRRQFSVPAFVFLPLWFVGQLFLANLSGGRGGVAFWAHVGGFAFGAAVAFVIAVTGFERRVIHPAIEAEVEYSPDRDFLLAMAQGDEEDWKSARATLARVLAREPKNVDARRYAFEVASRSGDPAGIAAHGTRLLEMYLGLQEPDLARELIRETVSSKMPSRFLLLAGDFLAREGDIRKAIDLYLRVANDDPADTAALRAFLQAADQLRKAGDAEGARAALDRGLLHPACSADWKTAFEKKLSQLPPARPARAGFGRGPVSPAV